MLSDQLLIARRGPLARVWLASHWERKISKSQFLQTNLEKTIDAITTSQQEPLTLRVSGQLLLGIVRIYSRKTRYLLEDCNEALVKIKLAFKKGDVNMPDIHHSVASIKSITLPERLTEFDILLPEEPFLADADPNSKDPLLDSLSQTASSQDITLSEISFHDHWDFDGTNEQGRDPFYEAEHARVNELDVGDSIEGARHDKEPAPEDSLDGISEPLQKMQVDDQQPPLAYDDDDYGIDFGFDFGDDEDYNRPVETQQAAEDFNLGTVEPQAQTESSQSTLMQSGLVADFDLSTEQILFDTPHGLPVPQPTRRRRKLVVDKVTEIPHEVLRQQVNDTSAIVDKNANVRKRNKTKKTTKIYWDKPIAPVVGSELFAKIQPSRQEITTTTNDEEQRNPLDDEMIKLNNEESNQQVTESREDHSDEQQRPQYDHDDDYGMDIDFGYDYDDIGPDPMPEGGKEQEPPTSDANDDFGNVNTVSQSSQSSVGRSINETLEMLQQRATGGTAAFGELASSSCTKAEAARRFYDVLLLTTKGMVQVQQSRPFGEIQIRV